jgi:hypothetical protein
VACNSPLAASRRRHTHLDLNSFFGGAGSFNSSWKGAKQQACVLMARMVCHVSLGREFSTPVCASCQLGALTMLTVDIRAMSSGRELARMAPMPRQSRPASLRSTISLSRRVPSSSAQSTSRSCLCPSMKPEAALLRWTQLHQRASPRLRAPRRWLEKTLTIWRARDVRSPVGGARCGRGARMARSLT